MNRGSLQRRTVRTRARASTACDRNRGRGLGGLAALRRRRGDRGCRSSSHRSASTRGAGRRGSHSCGVCERAGDPSRRRRHPEEGSPPRGACGHRGHCGRRPCSGVLARGLARGRGSARTRGRRHGACVLPLAGRRGPWCGTSRASSETSVQICVALLVSTARLVSRDDETRLTLPALSGCLRLSIRAASGRCN
jgi:hypothetical protein